MLKKKNSKRFGRQDPRTRNEIGTHVSGLDSVAMAELYWNQNVFASDIRWNVFNDKSETSTGHLDKQIRGE